MISLFFMYVDVTLFRCRFYIIVNSLSHRRDDCYINRVTFSRVTSRVTPRITFRVVFSSLITVTLVISKNSLTAIIFF